MERCIVTGGSGFVGISLVRQLVERGSRVVVYDLNPPSAPEIEDAIEYRCGDVRDRAALVDAARGCSHFFHIAAVVPLTRSGSRFHEINVGGVENAVAACLEHGAEHLVHLSSSAIYGEPTTVPVREDTPPTPFGLYGPAKLEGERVAARAREQGLPVAIIRPRTVIGPGRLGIFDLLFEWIEAGAPMFLLGACDRPFQLISNRDLSAAMIAAAGRRADGEYNVGADAYGSLRHDLEQLAADVGSPSRVLSIPAAIGRPVLRTLDALRLSPLVDWHYRTIDKEFWFDNVRPRAELDWAPTDSNVDMLREAYAWYLEHRSAVDADGRSTHRSPVARGALGLLGRVLGGGAARSGPARARGR